MPTIFREGSYRFFFYAGDRNEPVHVHIERDDKIAKVWLDPLRLCSSGGFKRYEIATVLKIIKENREIMVEGWNVYFND